MPRLIPMALKGTQKFLGATYRKFASSNTSRLEAHVDFFRLPMKGVLGPYVL